MPRAIDPLRRRAFTLVEASGIAILTAFVGVFAFVLASPAINGRTRSNSRTMRDATQLHNIVQALEIMAQHSGGPMPLPSDFDKADATIALAPGQSPRSKDTTANILSLLIWNGSLSPELFVSPGEPNPRVAPCTNYQQQSPAAAHKPDLAMWDPGFSADFTAGPAHNSYALLQPSGSRGKLCLPTGRLSRWRINPDPRYPIVANRAPQILDATSRVNRRRTIVTAPNSLTLRTFGPNPTWRGNIAFADGSVNLHHGLFPNPLTYDPGTVGRPTLDLPFYDEPTDISATNAYLGIFTTAGEHPRDFKAIFD